MSRAMAVGMTPGISRRLGVIASAAAEGPAKRFPDLGPGRPVRRLMLTAPVSSRQGIHTDNTRRGIQDGLAGRRRLQGTGWLAGGHAFAGSTCRIPTRDVALIPRIQGRTGVYETARQAWQRSLHTAPRATVAKRWNHQKANPENKPDRAAEPPPPTRDAKSSPDPEKAPAAAAEHEHAEFITSSVSKYFHLPHLPHRPTKQELLAAANGFWERLKVRFKWVSIRSMRPWNIDEWGAFISWFLFGHLVWILVGTTTFFSILIYSINTVFAQETLAKWIGDYLTQSAGLTVVFESAIVPKWKDGVISFRNVFVSRRPGQVKSSVSKGSSSNAAAVAAAGRLSDQEVAAAAAAAEAVDDGNYTQFDVTIATVNVTLSFLKWWNGKGLLKDVEVKGVRGVVDRTSVHWSSDLVDPLSYRYTHVPGDFEIDSFKMEDLLVTVHQPGDFRPFSVSIYSCELPQLRKQWLFYDFLSANHMSGSFDGSLFTIHPRQVHGSAVPAVGAPGGVGVASLDEPGAWKKFSRLRIDGLKIDHLNRGIDGPFGWIYEGNVDIVADVSFPLDVDEGIGKVVSDFYDQLEEVVSTNRHRLLRRAEEEPVVMSSSSGHISDASTSQDLEPPPIQDGDHLHGPPEDDRRFLVMDLRIHLNDVRAAVPLFTRDISYVNQALVRPIVAYINAKKTYIPITCRIVKRHLDFDGSWSVFDCGLMGDLSAETYEAFARDVEDQQSRVRRLKKVGLWTLSLAVHAVFMGMAGNIM